MSAAGALSVHGISLPQYAAVKAAQAEGFSEKEVLDVEGIDPRRWARADPSWKLRLVDDPSVFAAYEVELAAAEDWLDREVSPLGEDVESWARFLSAFAAKGAELLSANDLRLSDVSRLRRRWTRRIEQDPRVEERITELRNTPAAPPAIQASPAVLRPSRYARGRVEPAAAAAFAANGQTEPALTLDRYAALCAEIAERPTDAARTLARYGLSGDGALSELDRIWRAEMERAPELAADFRRLFAHNRARLSAPGRVPLPAEPPHEVAAASVAPQTFHAAPPAIREALRGTALVLDIPRGLVLPFAQPVSGVPPLESRRLDPPARSGGVGTGTALALDVPRGDALPFAKDPPGPAALPVAPRSALAETSALVDVGSGPALPFNTAPPSASRSEISNPVREAHSAEEPPSGPRTGTSLTLDVPRGAALPFAHAAPDSAPLPGVRRTDFAATSAVVDANRGPALPFLGEGSGPREGPTPRPASRNKLGKLALSLDIPRELRAVRPEQKAGPAPATMPADTNAARPAQGAAAPVLTLEQYASLYVELSMSPGREVETLVRYRLTPQQKQALDGHYGERIAKDPAMRRAWDAACRTYEAWLRTTGRGSP